MVARAPFRLEDVSVDPSAIVDSVREHLDVLDHLDLPERIEVLERLPGIRPRPRRRMGPLVAGVVLALVTLVIAGLLARFVIARSAAVEESRRLDDEAVDRAVGEGMGASIASARTSTDPGLPSGDTPSPATHGSAAHRARSDAT